MLRTLLSGLAIFLLSVPVTAETPPTKEPFLLGGIQVNESDHQRWTAALHQAGMNAVQTTVYAHQGAWHGPKLWYAEEEPSVLAEIRTARRNGLRVVLIPRVALDHNEPANRFLWHGLVSPRTEEDLALWFRGYTEFVVKWAQVAEEEDVEIFGVGSEMNSLAATLPVATIPNLPAYYLDEEQQEDLRALVQENQHRFTESVRRSIGADDIASFVDLMRRRNQAERAWAEVYTFADQGEGSIAAMNRRRALLTEHWRSLIREVREVYSGKLTFAANFDNYHEVAFWDRLDVIGINAYFPLRQAPNEPLGEEALLASWQTIFHDIDAFRAAHDLEQKVVFTELGYSRYKEVTVAPWTAHGFVRVWNPPDDDDLLIWAEQPFVPEERAMAVRALHALHSDTLSGILYWKLSSRIELQRYEPFMLDLGLETAERDPLLDALQLFSHWDVPDCTTLTADEPVLLTCVRLDRPQAVRKLLQEGADLGIRDAEGRTALHLAADLASPEMVKLLLAQGARGDAEGPYGVTPLHTAVRRGFATIVAPLIEQARSVGDHGKNLPVHYAAYYGKTDAFHSLWRPRDVRRKNRDGQSLLHHAAHGGAPEILQKVLERERRVDRKDRAGRTALFGAVDKEHVEATRILLAAGASADRIDHEGVTVLQRAAIAKDPRILSLVLARKPRLDTIDEDQNTALHLAAGWGRTENVRRLLAAGASSDLRNNNGFTPWEQAVDAGRKRTAEVFRDFLKEQEATEDPSSLAGAASSGAASSGAASSGAASSGISQDLEDE